MLPHPLKNFETQKYYQNEHKFNGVFSRNFLPKVKNEAYVINFDEYKSVGTHWVSLYTNCSKVIYLGSFWVKHITKEKFKKIKGNKNITSQQTFK